MTTIEDFSSYIKHFTRSNYYDFKLNLPTMPLSNTNDIGKKLRVFARNTSIPSVSAENHIERMYNIIRSTLLTNSFDSINITFFDTHNLFFHKMFNEWILNRFSDNGALKYYPNEIKGDIVFNMNEMDVYKLEGIQPVTVGDFVLDDTATDQYGTFDVTFNVSKLVPLNKGMF